MPPSFRRSRLLIQPSFLAFILLLCSSWPAAYAQNPQTTPVVAPSDPAKVADQQSDRRQALLQDQQTIAAARRDLESRIADLPWQLESLRVDQVDEAMVEQTRVDLKSARLRQEGALTELDNADRRLTELQKTISELETREQLLKNPAKDAESGAVDRATQLEQTRQLLAQQHTELELETLNLANLHAQVEVAKLRLNLAEQWQTRVERIYRQRQEQTRQDAQTDLVSRLQNELKTQQDRANVLKQRLSQERGALSVAAWQRLETELQTVEERINLLNLDRHLAETGAALARLNELLQKADADPDILRLALETVSGLRDDLRRDGELLQQKNTLYEQQRQVIEKRENLSGVNRRLRDEESQLVGQLLTELNRHLSQAQDQIQQTHTVEIELDRYYRERLRQDLFTRKPYPDSAEAWRQLWQGLSTVPRVLWYQVRLSAESAVKAMLAADTLRWIGLVVVEAALIWLLAAARRALRRAWRRCTGPERKPSNRPSFHRKSGSVSYTHLTLPTSDLV